MVRESGDNGDIREAGFDSRQGIPRFESGHAPLFWPLTLQEQIEARLDQSDIAEGGWEREPGAWERYTEAGREKIFEAGYALHRAPVNE